MDDFFAKICGILVVIAAFIWAIESLWGWIIGK